MEEALEKPTRVEPDKELNVSIYMLPIAGRSDSIQSGTSTYCIRRMAVKICYHCYSSQFYPLL
jgi:hypothetical protein